MNKKWIIIFTIAIIVVIVLSCVLSYRYSNFITSFGTIIIAIATAVYSIFSIKNYRELLNQNSLFKKQEINNLLLNVREEWEKDGYKISLQQIINYNKSSNEELAKQLIVDFEYIENMSVEKKTKIVQKKQLDRVLYFLSKILSYHMDTFGHDIRIDDFIYKIGELFGINEDELILSFTSLILTHLH